MAPFTVECQLEPRGDKWNPFGTPDSNSVLLTTSSWIEKREKGRGKGIASSLPPLEWRSGYAPDLY